MNKYREIAIKYCKQIQAETAQFDVIMGFADFLDKANQLKDAVNNTAEIDGVKLRATDIKGF